MGNLVDAYGPELLDFSALYVGTRAILSDRTWTARERDELAIVGVPADARISSEIRWRGLRVGGRYGTKQSKSEQKCARHESAPALRAPFGKTR